MKTVQTSQMRRLIRVFPKRTCENIGNAVTQIRAKNMKFPTSAQSDQSSLGTHCIAKDHGASLCSQPRFQLDFRDAQADRKPLLVHV